MSLSFSFLTAPKIVFGAGEANTIPALAAPFGRRALLVTGKRSLERSGVLSRLEEGFSKAGISWDRWIVEREPDTPLVDEGARIGREGGFDVVIAVGGGSVIDAGKAVAALCTNPGPALDYIEAVGGGRPIRAQPLPFIAAPTTAGSGSEVTKNSVVRIPELAVKRSIRSDSMIPDVAVIDPALIATAPRSVAASAGLDALTHLIEAYLSRGAQPTTDALVVPGMRLGFSALWALAEGRANEESYTSMALSALWGGMALANAGLGAVHGLVAPLGGRCGVPHGAGCGCLLPSTFAVNVRALRARAPTSQALLRAGEVAGWLLPHDGKAQSPERLAEELDRLRKHLGVPALASYGVKEDELPAIIAGSRAGSMKFNPIELTDAELDEILRATLSQEAASSPAVPVG